MPGTASSQIQSRSNTKARPSANVRAANLVANTPVLFRLPAIPNIPNAATQDLAVNFSESAANLPTATLAAVTLSSAQPTAPATEVSDLPQAAPQRTWWEHWSSGIVLIVLLIALATASILAWQGSNKGNSKLMADTKGDIVSQSDLSAIEVPRLEVPRLDLPISTNSDSHAEISSVQNGSKRKSGDEMDTSLIPSGPLSFDPTPIAEKSEPVAEIAEPESHATASLKSPVGKPQEPLFPDETLSKPNISAQPASTSTHRNAEKPSIWDSSNANLHDTNKPLTLELNPTSSSSAANLAPPANEPSNETLSSISASLISQPMAEAPATSLTSSATTLVPKDMQFAARTSTPEMDQAALLASYLQFAQTQAPAAPPAKPDNRYQSVPTAGSQNQAAGVGQQPNTQPAPSNNYTLQPAQSYLPNAQPQPNVTPQYQYQQYSAPQSQTLPQYGSQNQAGMQSQNNSQNQLSNNRPSPQYAGAQVPYPGQQPASQPSALQLPPGPIGGNGYGVSPPGTPFSTSSSTMLNTPNGGTANSTTNSPSYPSLR